MMMPSRRNKLQAFPLLPVGETHVFVTTPYMLLVGTRQGVACLHS